MSEMLEVINVMAMCTTNWFWKMLIVTLVIHVKG